MLILIEWLTIWCNHEGRIHAYITWSDSHSFFISFFVWNDLLCIKDRMHGPIRLLILQTSWILRHTRLFEIGYGGLLFSIFFYTWIFFCLVNSSLLSKNWSYFWWLTFFLDILSYKIVILYILDFRGLLLFYFTSRSVVIIYFKTWIHQFLWRTASS